MPKKADREREARIRERETICEVNGVVVLCRRTGGTLEAPEGLEGIAAYFESEGTPEDLYRQCRERVERYREALLKHACYCGPIDPDPIEHRPLCPYRRALNDGEDDGESNG